MGDRVRHTTERGTQRVPRYQMPRASVDYGELTPALRRDIVYSRLLAREAQGAPTLDDITTMLNLKAESDKPPTNGSLKNLWDNDLLTGASWDAGPVTITFTFPTTYASDMVRVYAAGAYSFTCEAMDEDTATWVTVLTGGMTVLNGWVVKQFDNGKLMHSRHFRIKFDTTGAVDVRHCRFKASLVADELLAGTLKLTDSMYIVNSDNTVQISKDGVHLTQSGVGTTELTPYGLVYRPDGGQESLYFRGLQTGIANDRETVALSGFLKTPKIVLLPYRMPSFLYYRRLVTPVPSVTYSSSGGSLPSNSTIYFAVTAYDDYGETPASELSYMMPYVDPPVNTCSVILTWTQQFYAKGYRVYVKNGSTWYLQATVSSTSSSYTITSLSGGTTVSALPSTPYTAIANQLIKLEAQNVSTTGFTVAAKLLLGGASSTIAIATWLYNLNDYYATTGLDPTTKSVQFVQIEGYVKCTLFNTTGFPGPPGNVGAKIRIERKKAADSAWTLVNDYLCETWAGNNPWFYGESANVNVPFTISLDMPSPDNWQVRVTYIGNILDNANWIFTNNTPDVFLDKCQWTGDQVIANGTVQWLAFDGGE